MTVTYEVTVIQGSRLVIAPAPEVEVRAPGPRMVIAAPPQLQVRTRGAQGPSGLGGALGYSIRSMGPDEPDTIDWNVDDLWYDTSTEAGARGGTWRRWDGSAFQPARVSFAATGGTVTDIDGYRIHTFVASGTFHTVGTRACEILLVGGGGGGSSGGGGGGGVIYLDGQQFTEGDHAVTIGAGGGYGTTGSFVQGQQGGNTSFDTLVAIGGGGGGSPDGIGGNGGSGGGGGGSSGSDKAGGSPTLGQGSVGGAEKYHASPYPAGGGGGAGGPATDVTTDASTSGGAGFAYAISGTTTYYGGGGAGRGYLGGAEGVGGSGGGGNPLTAGVNGLGGGGGGGSNADGSGAVGGSGVVIVRYPLT